MKYNTKELVFFGINAGKKRSERADRLGRLNYKKYLKNLECILPKMSQRYRAFFRNICQLHDSCVHQIIFGAIPKDVKNPYKKKSYVEICLTHAQNGKLYILKYLNIRKYILDYPSKQIMFFDEDELLLGDWYTDELCMTKDDWFTHEIIFKSGATLFIEFEKFSYKTERLKGTTQNLT